FTSTGYNSGDKGYAKVSFSSADSALNKKLPDIEVYADGGTAYINRSYYEELYTNLGLEVPQGLKDLKADYIGVDSGIDAESLKSLTNEPESLNKLIKSIFGNSDIDLPYTQNGREYTMDLNSDEAIDLGVKGIKAFSDNIENVNNTYKLGFTADDISEIKNTISSEAFNNGIAGVKDAIAGSTLKTKEVFDDDKYSADFEMNVIVKNLGNISFTFNSISTKSAVKDVEIPANAVKLTQEEFQKALAPANEEKSVQSVSYAKEIILNQAA
ncbi:MAG: hypothetical protein ACI398_06230, partial [Clostridium sp.]